jgi:hypothetical protein
MQRPISGTEEGHQAGENKELAIFEQAGIDFASFSAMLASCSSSGTEEELAEVRKSHRSGQAETPAPPLQCRHLQCFGGAGVFACPNSASSSEVARRLKPTLQ